MKPLPNARSVTLTNSNSPEFRCRVAFLCLLPDTGHVTPLVRIAMQAQNIGMEIRFFVPDEISDLPKKAGFPVTSIGRVQPPDARRYFDRYLGANSLKQELVAAWFFDKFYVEKLKQNILRSIDDVKAGVLDFAPHLIVVDATRLARCYRFVASACNALLLFHNSEGTCRRFRRATTTTFGADTSTLRFEHTYRWSQRLIDRLLPIWLRVTSPKLSQDLLARTRDNARREKILLSSRPPPDVVQFGTGLGILEDSVLPRVELPRAFQLFGPLPPLEEGSLPSHLIEWLSRHGDRPVVLISLGTMARMKPSMIRILHAAITSVGARALWAGLSEQDFREAVDGDSGSSLAEAFMPQPDLLANPLVAAMISHGGANSLQEAAWNGKPVICIPQGWDQPYNASIFSLLGLGHTIAHRNLTEKTALVALRKVLFDDRVSARAKQISHMLRAADGGTAVRNLLLRMSLERGRNESSNAWQSF